MENRDLIVESNILLALLKTTIEQSDFLIGEFKQRPKQVFNNWRNLSLMLDKELDNKNIVNEEYLLSLTDFIHNMLNELRKQHKKIKQ
jgi:hypothetical protein